MSDFSLHPTRWNMKIFVTGATGYIRGSVAERLIASGHQVVGLVRFAESIPLLKDRGIESVLGTLDDQEIITNAAHEADAIIHAASADHQGAVVTLIAALERSGKTLICTTGSGIVADSAAGEYAGSVVYTEDTYFEPVPFRRPRVAMNHLVRQAAIEEGIRSVVICPSMMYEKGRGLQPGSDQLPKLIALSKQLGAGVYFGKGLNRYSNVHIDDLVELYLLYRGALGLCRGIRLQHRHLGPLQAMDRGRRSGPQGRESRLRRLLQGA